MLYFLLQLVTRDAGETISYAHSTHSEPGLTVVLYEKGRQYLRMDVKAEKASGKRVKCRLSKRPNGTIEWLQTMRGLTVKAPL
jgi:hypothetical protein